MKKNLPTIYMSTILSHSNDPSIFKNVFQNLHPFQLTPPN